MQPKSGRVGILFSLLGLAGLALLIAGLGCPSRPTASPKEPKLVPSGRVVKVACPVGPATTVVERYGARWASQEGVRLEVVPWDPDGGLEAASTADVWVLATAQMPRWAAADALQPVPGALTARSSSYAWENMLQVYREKLLVWDGKVYALPLLGEELVCYYRADLLSAAQH